MKIGQIKIKAFSAKFRLPERTVSLADAWKSRKSKNALFRIISGGLERRFRALTVESFLPKTLLVEVNNFVIIFTMQQTGRLAAISHFQRHSTKLAY